MNQEEFDNLVIKRQNLIKHLDVLNEGLAVISKRIQPHCKHDDEYCAYDENYDEESGEYRTDKLCHMCGKLVSTLIEYK